MTRTRSRFAGCLNELRTQLANAGYSPKLKPHRASDGCVCWIDLTGCTSVRQLVWSAESGWFAVHQDNVPRPLGCDEYTAPRVFARSVMRQLQNTTTEAR